MIHMSIPRILSRAALAFIGAAWIAAVPVRAAPLSPSQNTALLLALFVNGDLAQGQQYKTTRRVASRAAAMRSICRPMRRHGRKILAIWRSDSPNRCRRRSARP
ncbi:MAG: hypothetical protein VB138_09510 [Burkholderia sp.]